MYEVFPERIRPVVTYAIDIPEGESAIKYLLRYARKLKVPEGKVYIKFKVKVRDALSLCQLYYLFTECFDERIQFKNRSVFVINIMCDVTFLPTGEVFRW